jgi:hypothetical protein
MSAVFSERGRLFATRLFLWATKPGSVMQLSRLRAILPADPMASRRSSEDTGEWLFRVISPMLPSRRYFVVGVAELEDARQLLQAHPDAGDDKIEAVGPVSIPNMLVFEVHAGEVKQIDTPYP